jgi:molybdopterin converting factor small subunit
VNPISPADTVTLELTGPLERLVGDGVVQLSTCGGRLGELLAALVEHCPDAQQHLSTATELRQGDGPLPPGFLVIRDGTTIPARLETRVNPGDRLTLLSIISGG